ncbi:MAG: hypothetical protein WC789_12640 [Lentisphaeria bacterium]|jgi:hypothetical protein
MLTLDIRPDKVLVRLTGWHCVWALKRKLEFSRAHIVGVARLEARAKPPPLRCPGTGIPRVLTAGSYWWFRRHEFWYTRHRGDAIAIELRAEKFTRVVLDVPDPAGILRRLWPFPP